MTIAVRATDESESQARLRAELDHRMAVTPAMLHSIDERGRLVSVSDAWLAKLGYTRDEVLGRPSADFLTPASREYAVKEVLPEFFRTGRSENIQYRMTCKDGRTIDVLLSAVLEDDPTGGGRTSLAVVTDITALKKIERLLAESEARYRLLAENSADMIVLTRHDGQRYYASPACRTLLGYEPEEMLEIPAKDAIHPDDAAKVLEALASGAMDTPLPFRMRRNDGSYVWVEAVGRAVSIAGQSHQPLHIVRDISKRVVAEQRLRESEARYRLLADSSTDMVFQLDRDLVRRYVSPACREVLGYEPEDMCGVQPVSMTHPDDAEGLRKVFRSLLDGETDRQSIINRIRHSDGRWIWVEAHLRAVIDPRTAACSGIVGTLRDISARKAHEEAAADANRRLRALAGEDGLTGLANRRAFDDALMREHRQAKRKEKNLALVMIDVDRFKALNDRYGHLAGDDCLRKVAAVLLAALRRPGDLAARYGGEEFAALLPDTDEEGAARVAERIRAAVVGLAIEHDASPGNFVTISAGVAGLNEIKCENEAETLVRAADQALYCAKRNGRDAVVRASRPGFQPRTGWAAA
jgi:diguanylate cyclase (GGDEF)-like protein/PAS domain S-box-containing protein